MTSPPTLDPAPPAMPAAVHTAARRAVGPLLHRLLLGLVGGYAFTWGLVALGLAGLVAVGADFHEAEVAMLLIAFLVFLPLFLWAFAAPRIGRVWVVLAGGAALMTAAAWALQRAVLT